MSKNKLLLCIDQGTTSSKTSLISDTLEVLSINNLPQENIYKNPGWAETDPNLMYDNVKKLCNESIKKSSELGEISGVGITNQRESCLIWDRKSGEPLTNAILWNDIRTEDIVQGLLKFCGGNIEEFKEITGLPITTYFSAFKFKYMMENTDEIKNIINNKKIKDLCFGTVDTWLIYKLTKGKKFVTDVTNASRTMLMNIQSLKWDSKMLNTFEIPEECLPEIKSSSDDFGETEDLDKVIPITGVIGDQQSACMGHCLELHHVKNTYGTGGFLMMNTGQEMIFSKHGLLTTVLYKNKNLNPEYALEGSIESAGNTLTWMKNNMNMYSDFEELQSLFYSVEDSGNVIFVPSFAGLFSPYWDSSARATIQGLTFNTTKGHIVRAAFDGVSFRTKDVINSFEEDTDVKIHEMKVDGGMSNSIEFLQTQANLAHVIVNVKKDPEITLIGSAVVAGIGNGIFEDLNSVRKLIEKGKKYIPNISLEEQEIRYNRWKDVVQRSLNCKQHEPFKKVRFIKLNKLLERR